MPRTRPPLPPVQAAAPAGLPKRVAVLPLRLEDIRPVVRIAHRQPGPLRIPERIIFDHELVLITRGVGEVVERRADGFVRHPFAARTLLCIPPFVPHEFRSQGECEHFAVHYDYAPHVPRSERVDRRAPYRVRLAEDLALPFRLELPGPDGIAAGVRDVIRLWDLGSSAARLGAQARLQAVLAELLLGPAVSASGDARVAERMRRVLAAMEARFAEPLTHGDLARIAGLGASRFSEVFRDWTGHTPKDWLRRVRLERARRMLADPSLTVSEVAERCGFVDPFHFSRVFRRYDGLSPTLWREAALAGRTAPGDGGERA